MAELKLKGVGLLTTDGWTIWSQKCKSILRSYSLWNYIEGPDNQLLTEAMKVNEWYQINDHICALYLLRTPYHRRPKNWQLLKKLGNTSKAKHTRVV